MRPLKFPITDILDLHTFLPKEIPELLNDYFAECLKEKIYSVRVIHGKGEGILKKRVHSLLKKKSNGGLVSFRASGSRRMGSNLGKSKTSRIKSSPLQAAGNLRP